MESLNTVILDMKKELERYSRRPDAKPYIVNKLKEKIAALENCVDLNDSRVDNQLLILLRDTIYKALYVDRPADALIIGMRLTDRSRIERIALADMIYSKRLDDPQTDLYELLQIAECDRRAIDAHDFAAAPSARFVFDHIIEGLDNYKA